MNFIALNKKNKIKTFGLKFIPVFFALSLFFANNSLAAPGSVPTVSQISPTAGSINGGTNVTITGTNFMPQNTGGDTGWTTVAGKTLPVSLYSSQMATIGNNLYLFGGSTGSITNAIYTASTSDPTTWTLVAGKTLPGNLNYSHLAIVGSNLYLFGGSNGSATNVIYTATVADPTTWVVVSGKTLPGNLYGSQLATVGNNLYLFGGYNSSAVTNVIYTASVSDPTTWTVVSGKTLPGVLFHSQLATVGDNLYLFGGGNSTGAVKVIYTASVSDPTTWTVVSGKTLPGNLYSSQLVTIGDSMYLLGGFNGSAAVSAIYTASISDPTTWTVAAGTLSSVLRGSVSAVVDDYVYLFGGYTSAATAAIYRAPLSHFRPNVYNKSWLTNWTTIAPYTDQSNVIIGGAQATNINFASATSITLTTPVHSAGATDVVVTNYDGQSATLTNGYTFNPAPTLSAGAVTPSSAKLTGGDSITITGAGFYGTPTVTLGGTVATNITVVNPTTITATTPAHTVGQVDVVVTNPDSQSATLTSGFTFTELPPTVSQISPDNGPIAGGTNVTITGTNFLGGNDSYTKLLLHNDGSGTSFADSSLNPKVITANGSATQSVAQSKFGGSSALLGSGAYLTAPSSTDFEFTGDYTVDAWVYPTSLSAVAGAIVNYGAHTGGGQFWDFQMDTSNRVVLNLYSNGYYYSLVTATVVPLNSWTHLAAVRSGNNIYIFINGVLSASASYDGSLTPTGQTLFIGRHATDATQYFPGYIDEFHVSKGVARWTSNFTPPTNAYAQLNVTTGGTPFTNVSFVNSTTITATTPAHVAANADVTVTNYDGQSATLPAAFEYHNWITRGTYTSTVKPFANPAFGNINWNASIPADTNITMRVKSCATSDCSDKPSWTGCDLASTDNGTDISGKGCVVDGQQFVQYQAYMTTDLPSVNPYLDSVTISDQPLYSTSSLKLLSSAFNTEDANNAVSKITWSASNDNLATQGQVQMQIRTAPDNGSGVPDWTNSIWCGPTDCSANPNSTSDFAASYYTDKTGATAINAVNRDANNDQWIQYATFLKSSDGVLTPTLSDVTVSYVVNAPPQLQNVAAIQEADGTITVAYEARDPDTSTGAMTNKLNMSLEYCSANCANSGSETWTNAATTSGDVGANVAVAEVDWSSGYQINWNVKNDYPNQFNDTDFKVRVRANDGEGANNIASAIANVPVLDTKNPTLGSVPLTVDASTSPATATLSATDDSSGLQMKVSTSPTLSGANWESFNATKNITLASSPSTVYAQFQDAYGNVSPIVNATTPEVPSAMMVQDTSNMNIDPSENRLFVAWKVAVAPAPGFASYKIYRSADQSVWSLIGTVADRLTNYYSDNSVAGETNFYYRVVTIDTNGNSSAYSAIVNGKANGIQDAGEGGDANNMPPVISNVVVDQITNVSARVSWTTDTLSNSTIGYSTTSGNFTSETGVNSMVTSHSVTIGNLSPNTKYYFQAKSVDALNRLTADANGSSGYDFTTTNGDSTPPIISDINVPATTSSTATITWNTNENSDSFIEYSKTNNFTSGALFGNFNLTTSHSVTVPSLEANATYYFKIHSKDASNNDSISTQQTFTTPPSGDVTDPIISGVTSSPTFNSATISWSTDESSTSYVEYGTTTAYGSTFGDSILETDHNVQLPTDLTENTTYHYRVHSTDGSQNEAISEDYTFMTLTNPTDLSAPVLSNIAVVSPTTSTLTVTWNTNENATSFVGYSYDGGNTFAQQGSSILSTNHSVTLIGLTPSTTYLLKVISADALGNIATGDNGGAYYTGVTAQGSQPPVLSSITASGMTFDEATITWNSNNSATSFVEYGLDTNYGNAQGKYGTATNHSITLTNLLAGQTYHFRVRSTDEVEAVSGDYTFMTSAAPDGAAPIVSAIGAVPSINSAEISWTTNEIATSYVEYGTDTNYGSIFGNNILTTNHSVQLPEDLTSDTTYHYRIRSSDASGNLAVSADNTTRTLVDLSDNTSPVISSANITSSSPTTITITWNTDENSTSYVAYSTDGANFVEQGSATMTQSHSVTLVGLSPSINYELQIKSSDGAGNVAVDDNGGANFIQATQNLPNAPVISNVVSNVTGQNVTITWTTDIDADSQVEYGVDTNYGVTAGGNNLTKNHSVVINGLLSGVTYHFRAHSTAETEGVSGDYAFTTNVAPDSAPPIVTDIVATPSINTVLISWNTNEAATSYVEYGIDTNYGIIFGSNTLTTNHSVQLPFDLSSNTIYHYRIRTSDALANLAVSADNTTATLVNVVDETAPSISNINISSSSPTSINIVWDTDEDSTSYVAYSTDGATFNEQGSATLTKDHNVTLVGLAPNVNYRLQIKSSDDFGNAALDDNNGANHLQTTQSLPSAPAIINVNASTDINGESAVITWVTDISSDSQIEYGVDTNYGRIIGTQIDTINHSVTINDLAASTTYHFRAHSTAETEGVSADFNFTTLPPPDASAPIISGVSSSNVSASDATITWNTNKNTDSILHYGINSNYTQIAGDKNASINTHAVQLENLEPNTTYHYQIQAKDAFGNISESDDQTFTTLPDGSNLSISNINVLASTQTTSVISWDTNKDASTKIIYSKDHSLNLSSQTSLFGKTHYIAISDLEKGTKYYFKVVSADVLGNETQSAEQSFETGVDASLDHDPLQTITFDDENPSMLTDTAAVISFTTDQVANCFIEFGTASGDYTYTPVKEKSDTFNKTHAMALTGLLFSTKHYYKVTCQDNLPDATAVSTDEKDFTTLSKMYTENDVSGLDHLPPTISNVQANNITGESATITWDSDEKSSSAVGYGIATVDENGATDQLVNKDKDNYSTTHSVALTGLIPATKYIFVASSNDASGNISQSSEGSFTTASPSSISSIKAESKNLGEAVISWQTDQETTSIVEYGLSTSYGEKKENSNYTKEHSIDLSNLSQGVTYHYRVKGKDKDGRFFASSDQTFEPKSPPQIKDIAINDINEHGATVTFKTDVPTDAEIRYTNVKNNLVTGSQGIRELSADHKIELTNLDQGTTFAVVISVKDEQGTEATKDAPDLTTGQDEVSPKIENVKTDSALTQSDKVQTIISWKTDEQSTSSLVYKEGGSGEEKELKITDNRTTSHIAVVTAFKAGTVYNFKVKSIDASGNESVSNNFALLTPKRRENIIQIIISNFQSIFGWAKF